jgi:hypothetical protein
MMVATKDNLDQIAALATRERSAGNDQFEVLVEPRKQVALYLRLWDGVVARVVGRAYYEEPLEYERNVDLVEPRYVAYVRVRVSTTDVIEAARRAALRGDHLRAAPLRVNRVAAPRNPPTVR